MLCFCGWLAFWFLDSRERDLINPSQFTLVGDFGGVLVSWLSFKLNFWNIKQSSCGSCVNYHFLIPTHIPEVSWTLSPRRIANLIVAKNTQWLSNLIAALCRRLITSSGGGCCWWEPFVTTTTINSNYNYLCNLLRSSQCMALTLLCSQPKGMQSLEAFPGRTVAEQQTVHHSFRIIYPTLSLPAESVLSVEHSTDSTVGWLTSLCRSAANETSKVQFSASSPVSICTAR